MTSQYLEEGLVAKAVNDEAPTLPSDWLLWAAVFSLLATETLTRPLLFGFYNRLVTQLACRPDRRLATRRPS